MLNECEYCGRKMDETKLQTCRHCGEGGLCHYCIEDTDHDCVVYEQDENEWDEWDEDYDEDD